MTKERTSYRHIVKATSLFGGVQVFNIIIQIVRSKIIAVLLGPLGMGISGLLNSTTGLIGSITNFGLGTSAVKNIAEVNESGDKHRISEIASILRYLVLATGICGTLITIIFSHWLSQLTFGNDEYTLAFIWISITLLFSQINSGQLVLLQGMRKLRYLASANLWGNLVSLIITVPLYYIFRINAIVPAIIASSAVAVFFSGIYSKKIKLEKVSVPLSSILKEGKGMLVMGLMLSLSGLITAGTSYLVRIFIGHTGSVEQVGLYNAGFTIINSYVGIVLSAMGTDYYPRLSSVSHSDEKCKEMINQQAEIAILILAPILMLFLVFINWIIILLYSSSFILIREMIIWAALGMFFKAASWSIGFILLAKGASKIFFWNELIANIYILIFNIIGYKYGNLEGLGISFLVGYVFYLIQVFILAKKKYNFFFEKAFVKIFAIQFLIGILCFLIVKNFPPLYKYLFGSIFIILSSIYSYSELDKRLDLKQMVVEIKNKYSKPKN